MTHVKAALPPAITNPRGPVQFVVMLGFIAIIAAIAHELVEASEDSAGSTMFLSLLACGLVGAVAGGVWHRAQNVRRDDDRTDRD